MTAGKACTSDYDGRGWDEKPFIARTAEELRAAAKSKYRAVPQLRPIGEMEEIEGNYAARTRAYNVRYRAHLVNVVGTWDMHSEVGIYSPNSVRNFYGLGNETENTPEFRRFYQARIRRAVVRPMLARELAPGVSLRIGPVFEHIDVRQDENRFVGQTQPGVSENAFAAAYYAGADANLLMQTLNNQANPTVNPTTTHSFPGNASSLGE